MDPDTGKDMDKDRDKDRDKGTDKDFCKISIRRYSPYSAVWTI